MTDHIRNPATERADRILDLLDNPTQRSYERGYERQQDPPDPQTQIDAALAYIEHRHPWSPEQIEAMSRLHAAESAHPTSPQDHP